MNHNYMSILRNCALFHKIPDDKIQTVLDCLKSKLLSFKKGEAVLIPDAEHIRAGILLEGSMLQFFYDEGGNQVTLRKLTPGVVFGAETSCSLRSKENTHCQAEEDVVLILLEFSMLLEEPSIHCPYRMQVTSNLLELFAKEVVLLKKRIRILSQKRLRDKIKIYLSQQTMDERNRISLPFNRSRLAEYLYVDRSALSRELGRLREEGILDYDGNQILIQNLTWLE